MKSNHVIPFPTVQSASRRSCSRRVRSSRTAFAQLAATILDALCYLTLLTCLVIAASVLVVMV